MLTSWTTIKELPLTEYYPCKINDEEYLILSSSLSIMKTNGITKYNAITNEFTKISLLFPNDSPGGIKVDTVCPSIVFDRNKQKVYFYGFQSDDKTKGVVYQLDLETKEAVIVIPEIAIRPYLSLVIAGSELHIISNQNDCHYIWNAEDNSVTKTNLDGAWYIDSLCFESLGSILSFNKDVIKKYSVSDKTWHDWLRDITTEGIDIDISDCAIVSTKDEKYVVMLAGEDSFFGDECNNIQVLNMETKELKVSPITCPYYGLCQAVMVDISPSLVSGYVRSCYQEAEFKDMQPLPVCLQPLIRTYMIHEYVHVFSSKDNAHWKINVDEIINSV